MGKPILRGLVIACLLTAAVMGGCGGGGAAPFTLGGTVSNDSGAPIASALVTATVSGQTEPSASATTSSTGVYAMALPPATYVVEASAAGYEAQQQVVTITASQPQLSVDFVLIPVGEPPPPPTNLGGRVTDATTLEPIAGATVTATVQGETTPIETTTTDANGRYGFWLATGVYVIRVTAAGFQSAEQTFTVTEGLVNLSADFALTPA